jgi:hypothetical protein
MQSSLREGFFEASDLEIAIILYNICPKTKN